MERGLSSRGEGQTLNDSLQRPGPYLVFHWQDVLGRPTRRANSIRRACRDPAPGRSFWRAAPQHHTTHSPRVAPRPGLRVRGQCSRDSVVPGCVVGGVPTRRSCVRMGHGLSGAAHPCRACAGAHRVRRAAPCLLRPPRPCTTDGRPRRRVVPRRRRCGGERRTAAWARPRTGSSFIFRNGTGTRGARRTRYGRVRGRSRSAAAFAGASSARRSSPLRPASHSRLTYMLVMKAATHGGFLLLFRGLRSAAQTIE